MLQNILLVALMSLNGSDVPGIPAIMRNVEDYGYVWDLNLGYPDTENQNCSVNDMSCVPTSWINNLVYLQNKHASELDGIELAGNDYAAWSENVAILRSADNMNTTGQDGPGTIASGHVRGMVNYLNDTGAGPLATQLQAITSPASLMQDLSLEDDQFPPWVIRGTVDMHQLGYWLRTGAAVVLMIIYPQDDNHDVPNIGDGHALALVGLEWIDENHNGIVDFGEGQLYVIDPADPTLGNYTADGYQPIGPAVPTTMQVWQQETPSDASAYGMLNFQYDQSNSEKCKPFNPTTHLSDGWLSGAAALRIIDGPGGSCCLATGCDVLTQVECTTLGGTWTLSGSCDDCAPACAGDTDNDGTVGIEDLLIVIERWGFCP